MGPGIVCGYKVLRELGSRALPSYVAIDPKPRTPEEATCVIELLTREAGSSAVQTEATAEFLRDAKRLTQLRHPNLVRVRDVVLGASTVLLVTDWVNGELYSDVARMAAEQGIPVPLAGNLRIVVDLLEGLSALHELCDAKREPLRIVHAEVAPRNLVVGIDGRSVLVHPLHAPPSPNRKPAPDVVGYLAPEVLLGDQTADQRADVYGAGVLLWEALTGQRMHADGEDAGEIVMRLLGGRIEAPCAPADAPWAAPLAEAAKRAVSPDPTVRFANATEMLAEVRRAVGARLAPKLTVSALVEAVAGERIRARNARHGASPPGARLPSDSAWTTEAASLEATPVASAAAPIDPEATKPPTSVPAPTSSRPRVAPSWGRIRHPSSGPTRVAAPAIAERGPAGPAIAPPGPPSSQSIPVSEAPASEDAVEVVEMEVAFDAPVPSRPPPVPRRDKPVPPRPAPPARPEDGPASLRLELTESKTDMAALMGPARPAGATKTRWTIAAAFALVAVAILWMLMRPSPDTRAGSDAPTVPSTVTDLAPPSTALSSANSAAAPPASASAHAGNDPSPFDPPASDDPRSAGRAAPQPSLDRGPIPVVRPSSPPGSPPASAPPAPAGSSSRAKKPVYDPMGI